MRVFRASSRYYNQKIITVIDQKGREIPALSLRRIPSTKGKNMIVKAGDRLDILSQQLYNDPTKFWHIADANTELDSNKLTASAGQTIKVPEAKSSDSELEKLPAEQIQIVSSRIYGKYKGIVKEVGEAEQLGYIKVEIPEIYGETINSPWVQPQTPFAGPNYGLLMLPKNGDRVWIEFEAGDISRPIWTGFWWSNKQEIPSPAGRETRVLVTPKGHKIVLDDENNEVYLIHASGPEIKLTSDEISLKIGASQIVINSNEVNINNGALVVR
jgi:hypothetical protein